MQSLIFMDDQLFLSRIVDDGFTIVDVSGQKGVGVSLENHVVGHTNADGRILVPGLQPYVANQISINPLDLPADADVEKTEQLVAPRSGGGLITHFTVKAERSALVTLVRPDASHPPVGAGVVLEGNSGKNAMVLGYDGQVYVRGIQSGTNRLYVTWPEGSCSASFPAPALDRNRLPKVGPLTCMP